MGTYRNDHEAALRRAEALEAELAELRRQKQQDADEIDRLEAKLRDERLGLDSGRPEAKTELAMVLGILSISLLPLMGPVAWWFANREIRAVEAGATRTEKVRSLQAARAFGMCGTVLVILVFVVILLEFVAARLL